MLLVLALGCSVYAAADSSYRPEIALGHIGTLKQSHTIVLRVATPGDAKPPALLHRASYNTYADAAWHARHTTFEPVVVAPANRWPLAGKRADAATPARITVYAYAAKPNPVLSLPSGTSAIENLNTISMQRNALGAVQIAHAAGYLSYTALYAGDAALDAAPTAGDLQLPEKAREAYTAVAAELGLSAQSATASAEQVKYFFANGYQYAAFQKDAAIAGSPMVDFLHRAKAGHCEYFATATVLLLRAGGIPARYATGFAVREKNERERAYIVRQRHAHTWARAFINGAWIDIDTTPPGWIAAEVQSSGGWTAISDRWSWLHFQAWQGWNGGENRHWVVSAGIAVLAFALLFTFRLSRWLFRRRIK